MHRLQCKCIIWYLISRSLILEINSHLVLVDAIYQIAYLIFFKLYRSSRFKTDFIKIRFKFLAVVVNSWGYLLFSLLSIIKCQDMLIFYWQHSRLHSISKNQMFYLKSNAMGATCGTGTAYLSGAPEFTFCFLWGSCCLIFGFRSNVL